MAINQMLIMKSLFNDEVGDKANISEGKTSTLSEMDREPPRLTQLVWKRLQWSVNQFDSWLLMCTHFQGILLLSNRNFALKE